MKLPRNSYVYDVINRFTPFMPAKNVCTVFWQLVLAHAAVVLIAYILTSPAVGIYFAYNTIIAEDPDKYIETVFIVQYGYPIVAQAWIGLCIIAVITIVFGSEKLGLYLYRKFNNRKRKKANKNTYKTKRKSIIKQYIKDKKDKVCTTIEWE